MAKVPRSVVVYSVIFAVGAVLLIAGLGVFFYLPTYINQKIHENLELRNGTEQADRFVKSPAPIYFSFYFFNVTNMDYVNDNGDGVILEELGPYVFREEKFKEVSSWDEENGVIRYKEKRTYFFEPNMTNGSLSDRINHVNAISLSLADMLEKSSIWSWLVPLIRGKYIVTHTVGELTFDGFDIHEYLPKLAPSIVCNFIDNCTFGFYYGRNGTAGKDYEISSGVKSMDDYTIIKLYNDKSALPYWFGKTCNDLNGTDGQQFPPGVKSTSSLYVFSDDVCRSLKFQYEKHVSVEGIEALQFLIPDSVFADPNIVRDNMCFCKKDPMDSCPSKAGVIPLSACQEGKPVFASAPHFYQGDASYWQRYKGLHPVKAKHDSYLNVEPLTGQVISAAKRLQVNILVLPDNKLPMLKIKNNTYFPVFWIEESGSIAPDMAADFRKQLTTPLNIGYYSTLSVAILGGVIVMILVGIFIFKRLSKSNSSLNNDDLLTNAEYTPVASEPPKSATA